MGSKIITATYPSLGRSARTVVEAIGLLAFISFGGGCFPSCGPSLNNDTCNHPSATGVTLIEQGLATTIDTENSPFYPIPNPPFVPIVRGGQGLTMIVTRLRFSGPDVPTCVDQSSQILDALSSTSTASNIGPLNTYPEAGTSARTTKPIFMPGYDLTGHKNFTTSVGSLSVTHALLINYTSSGKSCADAYLCAINCQFGSCEPACIQDLTGDGLVAYQALRACVDHSCPGPVPDMSGFDSDGGNVPEDLGSPCSGTQCAHCQRDAINLECRDVLSTCSATQPR